MRHHSATRNTATTEPRTIQPATTPHLLSSQRVRFASVLAAVTLLFASCGWQSLSESAAGVTTTETATSTEPASGPERVPAAIEVAGPPTSVETHGVEPQPVPTTAVTAPAPEASTPEPSTSESTGATTPPTLVGDLIAPAGMASVWTGQVTVNDETRPVSLWLAETQNVVRGEIVYSNTGETRLLLGSRLRTGFYLHEFDSANRVRTTFSVSSITNGVLGEITGSNELNALGPVALGPIAIDLVDIIDKSQAFKPVMQAGTFRYAFAPFEDDNCCGPTGTLTIRDVTATSVTVSIDTVTSGPGFNIATIEPTILQLDGNSARFEERNDWLDCAFDIVAFDDVVFVDYADERFDCGFGFGASVQGTYAISG